MTKRSPFTKKVPVINSSSKGGELLFFVIIWICIHVHEVSLKSALGRLKENNEEIEKCPFLTRFFTFHIDRS